MAGVRAVVGDLGTALLVLVVVGSVLSGVALGTETTVTETTVTETTVTETTDSVRTDTGTASGMARFGSEQNDTSAAGASAPERYRTAVHRPNGTVEGTRPGEMAPGPEVDGFEREAPMKWTITGNCDTKGTSVAHANRGTRSLVLSTAQPGGPCDARRRIDAELGGSPAVFDVSVYDGTRDPDGGVVEYSTAPARGGADAIRVDYEAGRETRFVTYDAAGNEIERRTFEPIDPNTWYSITITVFPENSSARIRMADRSGTVASAIMDTSGTDRYTYAHLIAGGYAGGKQFFDDVSLAAKESPSDGDGNEPSVSKVTFEYRNYGTEPNLLVNGERRVANFASLDGATVGGARVSVRQSGEGTNAGTVVLTGRITSFAVGGVEHAIDNVTLSTGSTSRTVRFSDIRPEQSTYDVGTRLRSTSAGVEMRVKPVVRRDGSTYAGGAGRVSDGEYWLGNTNLRFVLDDVGPGAPRIDASSVEIVPYPVPVGTDPEINVAISDAESASVLVDPAGAKEPVEVPLENLAGDLWSASLDDAAVLNGLEAGTEVDLTIRARNGGGTATLGRFDDEVVPDAPAADADLDYYLFEQVRDAAIVVGDVPSNSITGGDLPGPRGRRNWRFGREVYANSYYGSGNGSMGAVGFDLTLYTNDGRLYDVDRSQDHDERGYETASHAQYPVDLHRAADDVPFEQYDLWIASHPGEKLGRPFFCPRLPEQGWSGWGCDASASGLRTVYVTATGLVDDRGHSDHKWLHELGHDRGLDDLYEYDQSIITLMGNGGPGTKIGTLSRLGLNDGTWEPDVAWLDRTVVETAALSPGGRRLTVPRLQTLDLGDDVPVVRESRTDRSRGARATFVPEYRRPPNFDQSVVWLYRVTLGDGGGETKQRVGALSETGEAVTVPLGIRSSARLRFRLTERTNDEATIVVEPTAGRANTYTVVMQERTTVAEAGRLIAQSAARNRPDLDLIAVDSEGRRVGVVENETFVNEIPGARASGDGGHLEWISVPESADVRFRVRSEGIEAAPGASGRSQANVTLAYRTSVTHYGEHPRIVQANDEYAVTNATTRVVVNRSLDPGASAPALDSEVVAAATVSPNRTEPGETVTLDAAPSFGIDGTIETYEWDFDSDGTVDATGERVRTSFDESGTHEVSLVVTGTDGATDTTTLTVSVATGESDGESAGDGETSTSSGPGFGVAAAVLALLFVVAVGRR